MINDHAINSFRRKVIVEQNHLIMSASEKY